MKHKGTKGDFSEELTDRQLSDASYQMFSALSSALGPLPWSGISRADILSEAQATLEQFAAAYMEYLPSYLDYLQREYGLDTKAWSGMRELKEGRKLSKGTKESLSEVHEHVKSAVAALDELLGEDVDPDDTDADASTDDDPETKAHAEHIAAMLDLLR